MRNPSGQTNPTLRKPNAARENGRGLPQSKDDRRRRAAGSLPVYAGVRRDGAGHAKRGGIIGAGTQLASQSNLPFRYFYVRYAVY